MIAALHSSPRETKITATDAAYAAGRLKNTAAAVLSGRVLGMAGGKTAGVKGL